MAGVIKWPLKHLFSVQVNFVANGGVIQAHPVERFQKRGKVYPNRDVCSLLLSPAPKLEPACIAATGKLKQTRRKGKAYAYDAAK